MMRKFFGLFLAALLCSMQPALAQTQTGVIPGFMAAAGTDGCPAANACFVPYSATYPLPVQGASGGTPVNGNLAQVNGATVNVGTGAAGTGTQRVTTSTDSTLGLVAGTVIGGYEFNASVLPTVQNASYTAGQSLGGLQTISVGTTNSLTGILDQISVAATDGATTAIVVYVWDKNPTGTTCTDKTNFVVSQANNQHLIVGAPILLTPALVASGQDVATYAAATNLTGNFVNSSTNTDLYLCALTNATVTPGTTTNLRFNIQGIKDQP